MIGKSIVSPCMLQGAAEDFRQAAGVDDLWSRLRRHLDTGSITNVQYGFGALPEGKEKKLTILDSFVPGYLDAKIGEGVLEHDVFVRTGFAGTNPTMWSDTSRLPDLSPEARRSLDIDWDLGVTCGVSIPLRFAGGLGAGLIGLHAGGMSWGEFDRIWTEFGMTLTAVANAFDTALRGDHVGELFPLTSQERECLLWLATGLQQKQVADRLRLTDKQVEKRLKEARRKLKAVTTTQAVANALIFGLIDP
ncbi:LuxR family transcriptional regulator [Magnetospirillum sp. 15-1]|uniref:helix-turn-helix transcriptional regulator n=1 Tax=Magnetospirillum sp. 15-1 TaxID=1979370 RepID=UPI001144544F|nr:LuxR family transcriptional regulator [Magnetospirillum sp. 15-1]